MKVNRSEFLDALKTVKPAIPTGMGIDYDKYLVFVDGSVVACNEHLAIITELPEGVEGTFVVPSEKLLQVVSKMEAGDITVNYTKKGRLAIKGGDTKAEIQCAIGEPADCLLEDARNLLRGVAEQSDSGVRLPEKFMEAIQLCMYAASTDRGDDVALTCVSISGRTVLASNDLRVSAYTLDADVPEMLISAKDCQVMAGICGDAQPTYCALDSWDAFLFGFTWVICRKIDAEYPEVAPGESILTAFEFEGDVISMPAALASKVKAAAAPLDGSSDMEKEVTVTLGSGSAIVRGEFESGFVEVSVKDVEMEIDNPIVFVTNPVFLADILDQIRVAKVGSDRALFENGAFRHLVNLSIA